MWLRVMKYAASVVATMHGWMEDKLGKVLEDNLAMY